jgi:hypothetical protein
MLPDEEIVVNALKQKYAPYFAIMETALRTALDLTRDRQWHVKADGAISQLEVRVILGLYSKACKTYRSIMLCCEHGLGQDAQVLGRVLFETFIGTHFILQDGTRQHAAMYLLGNALQFKRQLDAVGDTSELAQYVTPHILDTYALIIRNLEEELDKETIKKVKRSSYLGQSLRDYCHDNGLGTFYDLFYRFASANTHVTDLLEHIEEGKEDTTVLRIIPGEAWLPQVIPAVTGFLAMILELINDSYGLACDDSIAALVEATKDMKLDM